MTDRWVATRNHARIVVLLARIGAQRVARIDGLRDTAGPWRSQLARVYGVPQIDISGMLPLEGPRCVMGRAFCSDLRFFDEYRTGFSSLLMVRDRFRWRGAGGW
jgi:hypothetical protein